MNWLNLTDEDVLKLAESERQHPIAAGQLLKPIVAGKRGVRVTLQREVVIDAVRRRKGGMRTRIKQRTV